MTMPQTQFLAIEKRIRDLWSRGEKRAAALLLDTLRNATDPETLDRHTIVENLSRLLSIEESNEPTADVNYDTNNQSSAKIALNANPRPQLDEITAMINNSNFREAIARLTEIVAMHSWDEAWRLKGVCYKHLGETGQAMTCFEQSLEINPNYAPSANERFCLLIDLGRQEEASVALNAMLMRSPDYPLAWIYKAMREIAEGQPEAAFHSLNKAASLRPDEPFIIDKLANLLKSTERYVEAAQQYEKLVDITEGTHFYHFDVGYCWMMANDLEKSLAAYSAHFALFPDDPSGILNQSLVLRDLGRYAEAESFLDENWGAVENLAEPNFVRGHLQHLMNTLIRAIPYYEHCLSIDPNHPVALTNLAFVQAQCCRFDEAIINTKKAIENDPTSNDARSNLLYFASYHPDYTAEDIYGLINHWNDKLWEPLRPNGPLFQTDLNPKRKLRVGFMSADMHLHVSNHYLFPLMENRDRTNFDYVVYSFARYEDAASKRYRKLVDEWYDINALSDEELTAKIRADEIDIMIDLGGHTVDNRIAVFARRIAPVQITWLGYGNTTGLSEMDYFVSSEGLVPPEDERLFSEIVHNLDSTFMCYEPDDDTPAVGPLPFDRNGYITFGSMTRVVRYNARVRDVWARVLNAVPNSKLLLYTFYLDDPDFAKLVCENFEASGLDPSRLILRAGEDWWDAYNEVDIALDAFPQNNGGTTFDTLWMGNPIITLQDRPPVGRLGTAILTKLGRTEWIATTPEDYVEKAVALASNTDALADIRKNLRTDLMSSPLGDAPRFAGEMEALFRQTWTDYCAAPSHHEDK